VTSSAEVAALVARNLAQRASDKMNDAIEKANSYGEEVKALQTRAAELNQTFVVLRQQLEANTANLKESGRKDVEQIESRLAGLEKLVADLSEESVKKDALTAYKAELNTRITKTEKGKTEFQNNSEYMVVVNYRLWAKSFSENIVQKLSQTGFRATASLITMTDEAETIVNAPMSSTLEVVTISYYWPEDAEKAGFVRSVVTEVLPGEFKIEMKQDMKVSDLLAKQKLDKQLGVDFSKRIDVIGQAAWC
jgi:seryl-tRNA synthetase